MAARTSSFQFKGRTADVGKVFITKYGQAWFRADTTANPVTAEFKKLLGLEVKSDRDGVLQDVHWYDGAFGYFPSYTLGAMIAAQQKWLKDVIEKGRDMFGMQSFDQHLSQLYKQGIITLETAQSAATNPADFQRALEFE